MINFNENQVVQKYNLRPGDALVLNAEQKIAAGLRIEHWVLYLGLDHLNQHLVAENNPDEGVQVRPLAMALESEALIKRIQRAEANLEELKNRLASIWNKIGKRYDLMHYNCESFVREMQSGKAISYQVIRAVIIAILVIIAIALVIREVIKISRK